jgi:uncharacterized membrane protein YedE/YeeE
MDLQNFTPWSALLGGALIGISASLLLALNGRIAGISGIVGGILKPAAGDVAWRVAFVIGLLASGAVALGVSPTSLGASPRSLGLVLAAGAFVGVGTRLGNGCTSGHGVCGLSRLSVRSMVATATFMATGIAAATLVRVLGGAS